MRTILTTLPPEKAQKELKLFALGGLALAILAFWLWWLAIAALPFSSRALLLGWHTANIQRDGTYLYRALSVVGALLSVAALWNAF